MGRSLLGSIVKPKTGLTEKALVEIITAFVEGGVDFIKEDEIMSKLVPLNPTDVVQRVIERFQMLCTAIVLHPILVYTR